MDISSRLNDLTEGRALETEVGIYANNACFTTTRLRNAPGCRAGPIGSVHENEPRGRVRER